MDTTYIRINSLPHPTRDSSCSTPQSSSTVSPACFNRGDTRQSFSPPTTSTTRDATGVEERETGEDKAPHLFSLEEKIMLLLLSRGISLQTYILGPRLPLTEGEHPGQTGLTRGDGQRYCIECVGKHLRFEQEGRDIGISQARDDDVTKDCHCPICVQGRMVERGARGGVVRWLRRRGGE